MIYLATPYSHPDFQVMEDRFNRAAKVAGRLMQSGQIVFCPITHTHPIAVACDLPRGFDYWEKFDRDFISKSEKVIIVKMEGWRDSKGVAYEIKLANEYGIPVEYIEEI